MIESELPKLLARSDKCLSEDEIAQRIHGLLPEFVQILLRALDDDAPAMLSWYRRRERGFNRRLLQRWKDGFDLLERLGVMCRETGEMALKEARPSPGAPEFPKFEALSRLHARACLLYLEIICLLKGGFADGALGRWRSLHETATVALFLFEQEPLDSERFLEYQCIDRWKRMKSYRRHVTRFGLIPYSEDEEREAEREYQRVKERFGAAFEKDWGWAALRLKPKPPCFANIEEHVGIDHLRPYYKWACEKIHASSNGLYTALGLFERENIMLAGPSHFGLADPAQLCAISLVQATAALTAGWGNLDLLAACNACQALHGRILDTFVGIQSRLEEDDRDLRSEEQGGRKRNKKSKSSTYLPRSPDGKQTPVDL